MNEVKKTAWVSWAFLAFWVSGAAWGAETKKDDAPVAVPSVSLTVSVENAKVFRYEWVDVTAEVLGGEASLAVPKLTLQAVMTFKGTPVEGVDGKKLILLAYQKSSKRWTARWPVPFSPPLGGYQVVVSAVTQGQEAGSARTSFEVMGRESGKIPKGFSVLTVEGRPDFYGDYPSPYHPEKRSTESLVEWAEWMGVDALWCLVGQTQAWKVKNGKPELPWAGIDLRNMERVAKKAKERGIKYGGWMACYYIWGNQLDATGYTFATKRSPKRGLRSSHFVTLNEPKRHKHLVELAQRLELNPDVSYIGFDYFRTDEHGGFEWVNEFVDTMRLRVPDRWEQMTKEERMLWLSGRVSTVSKDYHPPTYQVWGWYRARRMALELKSILEDAKVTKPVWIFTLGWEQGHQHGQDPFMLLDAGASLNSIMLYHCTRQQYEDMMGRWSAYLDDGRGSFVGGDMVDYSAHDKSDTPPAPEEAWQRLQLAAGVFSGAKSRTGLFWHDLSRILGGNRGPYSTMEWALAGATAFTDLRQGAGRLPIQLTLTGTKVSPMNSTAWVTLKIANLTDKPLEGVKIQWIDTESRSVLGGTVNVVGALAPGAAAHQGFGMKMERFRSSHKMAACVVTWGPGHYTDRAFAYWYVKAGSQKTGKEVKKGEKAVEGGNTNSGTLKELKSESPSR